MTTTEQMHKARERELVRRARTGDQHAFGELWRTHERYFLTLFRGLTDRDTAGDLRQELAIALWTSIPTFRGDSKFTVWAHTAAYRIAMREWSRRDRRPVPTDRITEASSRDHSDDIASNNLYNAALAQLPPAYRAAVVLADVHGFSHSEIAQISGTTEGASRVRVFRARHAMKAWLQTEVGVANDT